MPNRILILLASLLASIVLLFGDRIETPRSAEAAGASLGFPTVTCQGPTATAAFNWQAQPAAGTQWLDLALVNSGFAPGTFTAKGPHAGDVTTLTWPGLTAGVPYFWRVNTLTNDVWTASATGVFVPCGSPALVSDVYFCTDRFYASSNFRWAPLADSGAKQFVDLGKSPDFAPGTFAGAGPLSAAVAEYHWPSLQSNVTYYFRVNTLGSDGSWHTSGTGSFYAPCAPEVSPDLYGSADYLVGPGVNATVNVRDVSFDGFLGDPAGPWDVVRYNFDLFPALATYPGSGGTTLIAGHVDYHDCGNGQPCLSVFAPLRTSRVGDRFTYYRGDGGVVTYAVDWVSDLPADYNWNSLLGGGGPDQLILLTCNGTFDRAAREYNQRRLVHLVRVN